MTPIVEFDGVSKPFGSRVPLRIDRLAVAKGDRVALEGLDEAAAEMVVHLITGAAVPDQGTIRVRGRDTRDITTDTEWLHSLDRLGLVSHRAVLIDGLPAAANLALPLTVAVEPMSDATKLEVHRLAAEVGLPADRLDVPTSALTEPERVRVHLARALAFSPDLLLMEYPTSSLDSHSRADLGRTLGEIALRRGLALLMTRDDATLAQKARMRMLTIDRETGRVTGKGLLGRLLRL
jgi:predicted ABC-type transport system involved in lysophospholipase L1 biosynthesis ATPase subunit